MTIQRLRVGVLALQGAFREHVHIMQSLGVESIEVRRPAHLNGLDGLILPGGESTVMGKLMSDWDLLEAIQEAHSQGLALYGTCAGLILLCKEIEDSEQPRLGLLDAVVRRNAFGRQTESFECQLQVECFKKPLEAVFIRAPVLTHVGSAVQILATMPQTKAEVSHTELSIEKKTQPQIPIVAVRQNRILATSFHPELTKDTRLHQYFLNHIIHA